MQKLLLAVSVMVAGGFFISGCGSQGGTSVTRPLAPAPVATSFMPSAQQTMAVPDLSRPPGQQIDRSNVYSVQLELVPSKTTYLPGEPIEMQVTLTNDSSGKVDPVAVEPYPPVIYIVIPGETPEANKLIKTFPTGSDQKTLAMGEEASYSLNWDQKDDQGQQVAPGWYFYEFKYNVIIPGMGRMGSGGADRAFLIRYPQGAMQKTLTLNQTQTVREFPFANIDGNKQSIDLEVTLEQVEMSALGVSFLAVAKSAHNPVSGYNNPAWMNGFRQAQYVVDGTVKDARAANTRFLDSGIELRWGNNDAYLDPVPADAKKLTLVITRLGDWQGRLEFPIPLN